MEVLRNIRNTGDSRLRHQFFWRSPKYGVLPPSVLTGRIGLEWYLSGNGAAIASLVTYLCQTYPQLRERVSFDNATSKVLNILAEHAGDCFKFSFFAETDRTQELLEALEPDGLDVLCEAIVDWAGVTRPILCIVRLAGWIPEADVISDSGFWIRPSPTPPARLAVDFPLIERERFRFDCFPPDRHRPISTETDSLLGVIADGQQAARSRLRAMAGALCLSLEPRQSWLITGGEVDSLLVLIHESTVEWMPWEMSIPRLGEHTSVGTASLAKMSALLDRQLDIRLGPRLRLALESVGSGWRKNPKDRFLDHYAALDIWFDKGTRQKDVIAGVRSACSEDDGEKIGRLTGLRDELAHGRASTVEEAPSYLGYREVFGTDPERDLFRIAQTVLTRAVAGLKD